MVHFGFRTRNESRKLRWADVTSTKIALMAGKCLFGSPRKAKELEKARKMVTRDHFSPKSTPPTRSDAQYNITIYLAVTVRLNVPDTPFFLAVRHGKRQKHNNIWYMKAPLGRNEIGKFLTKATEGAGIQRLGSKISNLRGEDLNIKVA